MAESSRVVLVTGGSKGIGRTLAERFRDAGYRVAATYRSGGVPDGVLGLQCDITDQGQVEAAFAAVEAELGPVEILVANAGVTKDQLLMRMTDEEFETVLDVNLTGTFRCVRRASKGMIRMRRGRIVLISSVVGLYGGPGQVNYSSSKAALVGMARSITRELGGRGITANVVAPGFIETAMTAAVPLATREGGRLISSLNQGGETVDVAETVAWFANPASSAVTGQVVRVCGQSMLGA